MSSAVWTGPRSASSRLVVDTDVASYIFKWHPDWAPRYAALLRGHQLVLSFMTVAELRQGALDAMWGKRKRDGLEAYLAEYSLLHSDDVLCSIWANLRSESFRKGRAISSADAWIAASAIALEAPLVTNNARDYSHLTRLQLLTLP